MLCDRCGHSGFTICVREPGRVPLRVDLCQSCLAAWNTCKARLFDQAFEQAMPSAAEVKRRFEELFRNRR